MDTYSLDLDLYPSLYQYSVLLTRQIAGWCDMSGSAGAVPGAIHRLYRPSGRGCRRLKHPRKSIWANSQSALDRLDGARLH